MKLSEFLATTTQEEFAKRLGVTQGAVSQWLRGGVPVARAADIERATRGLVTRVELLPEIFGPLAGRKRRRA
jgi:DNA-binding transcriptional regulator YdaS (Cro superfamily)